jgi:hypothetical protein
VCRGSGCEDGSEAISPRASAFTGAVDITASLQRFQGANDRRRNLRLSGRAELPDAIAIELTDNSYVVLGEGQFNASEQAESALLANLVPNSWVTEAELRQRLPGLSRTTLRDALERLRQEGPVARLGAGKKGDPYRFSLSDETTIRTTCESSQTNHASRLAVQPADGVTVF